MQCVWLVVWFINVLLNVGKLVVYLPSCIWVSLGTVVYYTLVFEVVIDQC